MSGTTDQQILSDSLLLQMNKRAAAYDEENRFFHEDFEDLRAAGYLAACVPREFGGRGLDLVALCREQRRLAYHAPATALGIHMNLYWTGLAVDLRNRGDHSLDWLLREAAAGEVFASGHSEEGNDLSVVLSTSKAQKVDGGFTISGRKRFGSLAPVWTRYGTNATWTDADGHAAIIHGFLPRDGSGYRIVETWNTLGMRPTCSDDVLLEDAFIPDRYVARIVPAGGLDVFILGMYAWALLGWANIYCGIAKRAINITIPTLHRKSSLALGRSMAYHPEVQHAVADMTLAFDPIIPHLERVARDWATGVDHGTAWPSQFVSAKYHAVEACWRIVDLAMDLSGGSGMFRGHELERLFRDARCGRFHPANSALVHEIVGKTALGIELGEQPRWG